MLGDNDGAGPSGTAINMLEGLKMQLGGKGRRGTVPGLLPGNGGGQGFDVQSPNAFN